MHAWHAHVVDDDTGFPLDDSQSRTACYTCHPGSQTRCLRGVMANAVDALNEPLIQCQSCHGNMSKVGDPARQGWLDMPSCQACHYRPSPGADYVEDTSVFDVNGAFRQGEGAFGTGANLYKLSTEHGGMMCEACHGSTHAEGPSSEPNDNVQNITLQGYDGKLTECSACHVPETVSLDGGPHGLHTVGQAFVSQHGELTDGVTTACASCHGQAYQGSVASRAAHDRVFAAGDFGTVVFARGTQIGCYDCHEGPSGEH
jgi:uncharacterized CHY-type Zn-finger protein